MMRGLWVVLVWPALGCAASVSRLPGEVSVPPGPASGACESAEWLVLAPTRREEISESGRTSQPRDDGLGLYRVGERDPQSIPALAEELGPSPILDRHVAGVKRHDDKQLMAAGLGAAGLVALGIGTCCSPRRSTPRRQERRRHERGEPGHPWRSPGRWKRADRGRLRLRHRGHAGQPQQRGARQSRPSSLCVRTAGDEPASVQGLVTQHNQQVRQRCSAAPAPR